MFTLQPVLSFLGFFPDLIVLIVCISYLIKFRNIDGVLLFAGSIIHIIVRIFFAVVPYLSVVQGSDTNGMMELYAFGNFLSLIGSILFCFGIVMLIRKVMALLTGVTRS